MSFKYLINLSRALVNLMCVFHVQFSNSCRPTSRILDYTNIVFEIKTVMHSVIIADTVQTLLVFRDIVVMVFQNRMWKWRCKGAILMELAWWSLSTTNSPLEVSCRLFTLADIKIVGDILTNFLSGYTPLLSL